MTIAGHDIQDQDLLSEHQLKNVQDTINVSMKGHGGAPPAGKKGSKRARKEEDDDDVRSYQGSVTGSVAKSLARSFAHFPEQDANDKLPQIVFAPDSYEDDPEGIKRICSEKVFNMQKWLFEDLSEEDLNELKELVEEQKAKPCSRIMSQTTNYMKLVKEHRDLQDHS